MGQGDGQDESSASGTDGGSQAGSTGSRKLIDLRDCLRDSPRFRVRLAEHEGEIADLETKLERVVTSCDRMVNNGQAYVEACRSFSSSVRDMAGHFHDNSVVEQSLRRFYDTLAEVQSFHSILFDQAQRSVQSALRSFLTGELKKVKEMKKTFHKVSEELNSAIHRNAHVPRSKPQEAEELSTQLANMQTQFSHKAIDYGYHINAVSCSKGYHILNHLLSYMRAQYTFFHQGYDLLHEFDPYMRHILSQVDDLQKMADEDISSMNSRHSLVIPQHLKDGTPEEPLRPMDNPAIAIELEGYLFKRSSGAFKTWNRRWFVLRNNQFCYQSESKTEELAIVVEDLRICTIKMADDLERRFCFEVVTPARSSMLQADSEALRKTWLAYLEGGIARALRISASGKKKDDHHELRVRTATLVRGRSPTPELSESPILGKKAGSMASLYSLGLDFLDVPGNDQCADCGSLHPKWASINLGITLCIECCGIHRNLGVHISKVRSITLDEWEPEIQMIMCGLGNNRVNAILEYEIPEHVKTPTPNTSRSDREVFIRAKYVLNAFVHPHPDFERPEIPLAPQQPSLQQLLTSNRERQAENQNSPRTTPRSSPQTSKRMISPSIRLRATKRKSYRPLSQSVSAGPELLSNPDSFDSDDDALREFQAANAPNSSGATSSMALLAENYKKLEKSGKLKNWSITKMKTPRKSSFTQLSGKFSKSYQALNRKFRADSTKSAKSSMERDAHSDNEDPESSATPLLHSKSASSYIPPTKPPRTFKQRKLDLTGDGDAENVLLYNEENDDFSGDVLSAIREMGVVAVLQDDGQSGCNEEEREERFSKSLPNGGFKILSSNDGESLSQSSSMDQISPTPPGEVSPLTSEAPVCAVFLPPTLSPVHEGEAQVIEHDHSHQSPIQDDNSDTLTSPAFSTLSQQTSVFDENTDKPTLEIDGDTPDIPSVGDDDENITHTNTATISTTVQDTSHTISPSDETYQSTGCISSEKPFDNSDDGFTEFQSAVPALTLQEEASNSPPPPPSSSVGVGVGDNVQQRELKVPNTRYDDNKRMSMISVTSTDWFSLEEDEEEFEEDNVSNYSAEFPELKCAVNYSTAVCPNPLEEEQNLFSTPPSSPPLTAEALSRERKQGVVSDSDRSSSNSPRPKSASPLTRLQKSRDMERRRSSSPRCKSASSISPSPLRESPYEETEACDQNIGTLRPKLSTDECTTSVSTTSKSPEEDQDGPEETGDVEQETNILPVEVNENKTIDLFEVNLVSVQSEEIFDDTFEDATDTVSIEDTSELYSTSTISMDAEDREIHTNKKSYSADTSPKTIERHENISSVSLTQSATDITIQSNVKQHFGVHTRSRSSTVHCSSPGSGSGQRRLEEAPNRSKDEDYFAKLIHKTDKEENMPSQNRVTSFSDQDFADILRSSLRGKKVPLVRVESADDHLAGVETAQKEEDDGEREERVSENHLQPPSGEVEFQETTAVAIEPMETLIIPDDISPDMYLYQSVCTYDMAAILCAKAHGGDINFINIADEGKTPMLIAIERCSTVLVEFLYQNGAKLTVCDERGRGCLHYAALTDDASVVILLLRRGAKADVLDADGKDPVQMAIDKENGDIVTLLRVTKLKQDDRGNLDDQVAEVYKDFEVAVQVDPERMKRRSQASSDNSSIASRELKQ